MALARFTCANVEIARPVPLPPLPAATGDRPASAEAEGRRNIPNVVPGRARTATPGPRHLSADPGAGARLKATHDSTNPFPGMLGVSPPAARHDTRPRHPTRLVPAWTGRVARISARSLECRVVGLRVCPARRTPAAPARRIVRCEANPVAKRERQRPRASVCTARTTTTSNRSVRDSDCSATRDRTRLAENAGTTRPPCVPISDGGAWVKRMSEAGGVLQTVVEKNSNEKSH